MSLWSFGYLSRLWWWSGTFAFTIKLKNFTKTSNFSSVASFWSQGSIHFNISIKVWTEKRSSLQIFLHFNIPKINFTTNSNVNIYLTLIYIIHQTAWGRGGGDHSPYTPPILWMICNELKHIHILKKLSGCQGPCIPVCCVYYWLTLLLRSELYGLYSYCMLQLAYRCQWSANMA